MKKGNLMLNSQDTLPVITSALSNICCAIKSRNSIFQLYNFLSNTKMDRDATSVDPNLNPMNLGPKNNLTDKITNPNKEKSWYSEYYDASWRWVEDTYLKYFGENRTSYGTKGKSFYFYFLLLHSCMPGMTL